MVPRANEEQGIIAWGGAHEKDGFTGREGIPGIAIDTVASVDWGRRGFFVCSRKSYRGRFNLKIVEGRNSKAIGGKVDMKVVKGIGYPFIIKFP